MIDDRFSLTTKEISKKGASHGAGIDQLIIQGYLLLPNDSFRMILTGKPRAWPQAVGVGTRHVLTP